jgi:hypothetical protein
MSILKPLTVRKLHYWHSGGDVFMRADFGRGIHVPEAEHAHLRGYLRALARAARNHGDQEANRLWTAKWRDLGDAMAALEHHKLVCGRGLREQLQASVREIEQ